MDANSDVDFGSYTATGAKTNIPQQMCENAGLWYGYYSRAIVKARLMRAFTYLTQWDDYSRQARYNKATLEFNVMQPIARAAIAEFREADMQWKFSAGNSKTEAKNVYITEGIARKIAYDSNSKLVYQTAFQDGINCGWGASAIGIEYAGPKTFNQKLTLEMVPDVFSCFWDVGARRPDKTDGQFAGRQYPISVQEFKRRWPKANVAGAQPISFDGVDSQVFFTSESICWIVEYQYREFYTEHLVELSNGKEMTTKEFEELKEDYAEKRAILNKNERGDHPAYVERVLNKYKEPTVERRRTTTLSTIKHCLLTTMEVLEETEILGDDLLITYWDLNSVIINGRQVPIPLLETALDTQRLINYTGSSMADGLLKSRREQYIGTPKMINGYGELWKNPSNVQGILLANMDNNMLPQAVQVQPFNPALPALFNQMASGMRQITGRYADSLGDQSNAQSGIAVMQKQMQGNLSIGLYPDNAKDTIANIGRTIAKLIPLIYDAEREVMVMDKYGESKAITINKRSEFAQYAAEQDDPDDYEIEYPIENHLENTTYDVRVEAGSSFQAQRQINFDQITQLMQASESPLFQIVGDELAANLDLPNTGTIVNRVRKYAMNQTVVADEQNKPPPPPPPPTVQEKIALAQQAASIYKIKEEIESINAQKFDSILSLLTQLSKAHASNVASEAEIVTAIAGVDASKAESTSRIVRSIADTEQTHLKNERDTLMDAVELIKLGDTEGA